MFPGFFKNLLDALHPLLESCILLAALVAVLLNVAFFDGLGRTEHARAGAIAAAEAAEHV